MRFPDGETTLSWVEVSKLELVVHEEEEVVEEPPPKGPQCEQEVIQFVSEAHDDVYALLRIFDSPFEELEPRIAQRIYLLALRSLATTSKTHMVSLGVWHKPSIRSHVCRE